MDGSETPGSNHQSFDQQPAGTAVEQAVPMQVHEATERIRVRMRRAAEDIVAIGQDLKLIKEQLPHGAFMPYIERELGMSWDTAQNLMHAAERFGDKIGTIPNVPPTALYALSEPSVSEELADEVLAEVAAGRVAPTAKAVKTELRQRNAQTSKREARVAGIHVPDASELPPRMRSAEPKSPLEQREAMRRLHENLSGGIRSLAYDRSESAEQRAEFLHRYAPLGKWPDGVGTLDDLMRAKATLDAWVAMELAEPEPATAGDEPEPMAESRVSKAVRANRAVYEKLLELHDGMRTLDTTAQDFRKLLHRRDMHEAVYESNLSESTTCRAVLPDTDMTLKQLHGYLKDMLEYADLCMTPERYTDRAAGNAESEPPAAGDEPEPVAKPEPEPKPVCAVCDQTGKLVHQPWGPRHYIRVHRDCQRKLWEVAEEREVHLAAPPAGGEPDATLEAARQRYRAQAQEPTRKAS